MPSASRVLCLRWRTAGDHPLHYSQPISSLHDRMALGSFDTLPTLYPQSSFTRIASDKLFLPSGQARNARFRCRPGL